MSARICIKHGTETTLTPAPRPIRRLANFKAGDDRTVSDGFDAAWSPTRTPLRLPCRPISHPSLALKTRIDRVKQHGRILIDAPCEDCSNLKELLNNLGISS
jgi:hypothetical protein